MKKINFIFKAMFFSGLLLITSCSIGDNSDSPRGDFENGLLISGEGAASSGSISFISEDYSVNESKIYSNVNGADLGTFLQSIAFDNDNAYIVVDNQNTVTIVDRYTFENVGQITNELSTPRYMAIDGDKGYITNWGVDPFNEGDDFITVVDINTFEFIEKITVGHGPEKILVDNGKLYVSHLGAFTTNNIVSVVDIDTKEVTAIEVADRPDEIYLNADSELIVLSEGGQSFHAIGETLGAITTINLDTNSVSSVLAFNDGEHPTLMSIENDIIYYGLGNDIYSIPLDTNVLASTPLFSGAESFLYGLEVENSKVYTLDASFIDVSKLNITDLNTSETTTLEAPLGASKIYFN